MRTIKIDSFEIGGGNPLALIAGPCVIEEESLVLSTAEKIKKIASKYDMPLIFKSSFLKDNRSSTDSYQGPGLDKGLKILDKVKREVGIPVLSDVHQESQVKPAAEVLDVIQIPAYLSMQTSLSVAAAKTGKVINVKKGQFLHPEDMKNIIGKIEGEGNSNIMLTERGACFGYRNLVVDMRSFQIMRSFGYPVVFDPTHSIRIYGISSADARGGAPQFVPGLSRAAVAAGIDVIFIETHPDCKNALCDAASMWPLNLLDHLLSQIVEIDKVRRSQQEIFLKI
ncbi:3-deoxy-8-phosphooctulonate synthase [bacterium]|nr:3-deoxy-8-phosphooctulonate synthase [bacterium]